MKGLKDAMAVFAAAFLVAFLTALVIGVGVFCWGFGQGMAQALFSL